MVCVLRPNVNSTVIEGWEVLGVVPVSCVLTQGKMGWLSFACIRHLPQLVQWTYCVFCSVQVVLCSVQVILCSVQFVSCSVQCAVCGVLFALYSVQLSLCSVQFEL